MFGVSSLGTVSVEEIGSAISTPKLFQLYFHKDRGLTGSMIERGYRSGDHHERDLDEMVMVGGHPLKREDPNSYPRIAGRCDRTRECGKHEVELKMK